MINIEKPVLANLLLRSSPPEQSTNLQQFLLILVCPLHGHDDQPGTLAVLDIGAMFASDLGIAKAIQIVILNLEKATHFQHDGLGLTEQYFVSYTSL